LPDVDDNPLPWNKAAGRQRQRSSNTSHASVNTLKKGNGLHKIIGSRSANDSNLNAGVEIVQRVVLRIDNLHQNCTEALLIDYLRACKVQVLTCYPAKSWLREKERDSMDAFPGCIPASEKQKICNPEVWFEKVIIRGWKFKSKK